MRKKLLTLKTKNMKTKNQNQQTVNYIARVLMMAIEDEQYDFFVSYKKDTEDMYGEPLVKVQILTAKLWLKYEMEIIIANGAGLSPEEQEEVKDLILDNYNELTQNLGIAA